MEDVEHDEYGAVVTGGMGGLADFVPCLDGKLRKKREGLFTTDTSFEASESGKERVSDLSERLKIEVKRRIKRTKKRINTNERRVP